MRRHHFFLSFGRELWQLPREPERERHSRTDTLAPSLPAAATARSLRPMSSTATPLHPEPPPTWKLRLVETILAILLILQTAFMSFLVYAFWPLQNAAGDFTRQGILTEGEKPVTEQDLLLLVMACGGLGATLHALYSFCDYVGNRRFQLSWFVWYVGRMPIGMAVATVLYLALRGGFTGFSGGLKDLNLYGIAGIAALTGMFSRHAVTKLSEIATTIFTKLPPQPDALQNPRAALNAIKPATIHAGSTAVKIKLEGRDFVPGLRVVVDHMFCETTWKSPTEAEFILCDKLIDDPTMLTIAVRNPDPCPGESETRDLAVVPAGTVLPEPAKP